MFSKISSLRDIIIYKFEKPKKYCKIPAKINKENYRSKNRADQNNRCHENVGKFCRNIVSSEISSKSHEKPGISLKFVCITFAQYCKLYEKYEFIFREYFHSHFLCISFVFTFFFSGLAKRDVIWDKKAAEVVRSILAHMKLNNQQLWEEKPFRVRIASSHEKSTEELSKRVEFERRRFSLPSNTPQQQQLGAIGLPHQRSEPLLSQMNQSRKLNLSKLFIFKDRGTVARVKHIKNLKTFTGYIQLKKLSSFRLSGYSLQWIKNGK